MRTVALTRQRFPFALAMLAGALFAHGTARGVVLGNVASQSGLGQPLKIVIPLKLSHGETLNAACVRLVADNSSGAPEIVTGRVNIEQDATNPRLVITTSNAMREPAARLAVQAGCGSTSRRDYVLFFDPPALQSPTLVASADEEPAWLKSRNEPATKRAPSRVNPIASTRTDADPAPRLPAWGTPVATGPMSPAHATPEIAPAKSIEPRPVAPFVASAPPPPVARRDFVSMVGAGSGTFIPEAAAAPVAPRAAAPSTRPSWPQSIPLVSQPQPSQSSIALAIFRQTWQYAAGALSLLLLALSVFAMRRRLANASSWFSRDDRVSLKGETQAGAAPTFAHFGVMTEPASIKPRAPIELPEHGSDHSVSESEFDTLLVDLQDNTIDEKAVKAAWVQAASEAAKDIGTDSILKAIAAAERDLNIAVPEPPQLEMDAALDEDLLALPNAARKPR